MKYLRSKIRQLNRHIDEVAKNVVVDGVSAELTNLVVADSSELVVGQAYTCTLAPSAGFYLPPVISITGTTSTYGFKYDHTTGVIYIPSDEVIGDIVITAEASDVNWNVPAQFEAHKVTIDTYNDLDPETFLLLTVTPSRGSTVQVTYGDLTKTVTGALTTDKYNSNPVEVFFGSYFGTTDEVETPDSGILTISGAYESFDLAAKVWTDEGSKGADTYETAYILNDVINIGAPRYLNSHSIWTPYSAEDINIVFNTPIGISSEGDSSGIFGYNGSITYNKKPYYYSFDGDPVNPNKAELYAGSTIVYTDATIPDDTAEERDNFLYDNGRINTAYYNIDFGEWLEKSRMGLIQYAGGERLNVYVNGEDVYNLEHLITPDSCRSLTLGSFDGFDKLRSIELSEFTGIDYEELLLMDSALETFRENMFIQYKDAYQQSYPDLSDEEIMIVIDEYISEELVGGMLSDAEAITGGFFPSSCESITVNPANEKCYVENNCIITKDEEKVLIVGHNASIIPNGVKIIAPQAFAMTDSDTIVLPDSLNRIGAFSFYGCPYRCALNIPNNVTHIGFGSFANMLNLNGGIENMEDAFGIIGELIIPDNIQNIGECAFLGNVLLAGHLNIPYGITQINNASFGFTSITSVTIPESVIAIYGQAFMMCESLSSVDLPDSIRLIGYCAFSYCSNLSSINLPSSLKVIGASAFSGCTNLSSISLPTSLKNIGESAFSSTGITHIEIPASVMNIGNTAFNSVTSVTMLSATPPTIGASTFTTGTVTSIVVPAGAGETYKAAENWSAFADIIVEAT